MTKERNTLLQDSLKLHIDWRKVLERDERLYAARPEHSAPQYWENALALAACAQELATVQSEMQNLRASQSALEVA